MYRKAAVLLAATALGVLSGCGGGGDSDNPTPESVAMRTKNRPLNNCVSVQSGQRPTRPLTREEQEAQRKAEIAALPPECQPKKR